MSVGETGGEGGAGAIAQPLNRAEAAGREDPDMRAPSGPMSATDDRVETLVREVFGMYERAAPELRVTRAEPDVHPVVRRGADALAEPKAVSATARAVSTSTRAVPLRDRN